MLCWNISILVGMSSSRIAMSPLLQVVDNLYLKHLFVQGGEASVKMLKLYYCMKEVCKMLKIKKI